MTGEKPEWWTYVYRFEQGGRLRRDVTSWPTKPPAVSKAREGRSFMTAVRIVTVSEAKRLGAYNGAD